jgi:hypothetical protein
MTTYIANNKSRRTIVFHVMFAPIPSVFWLVATNEAAFSGKSLPADTGADGSLDNDHSLDRVKFYGVLWLVGQTTVRNTVVHIFRGSMSPAAALCDF